MIKIGLEYEGVITRNNKITRFKFLPKKVQESIERRYKKPYDNYDCLAECRTPPFEGLSTRNIAYYLFNEVTYLNTIYEQNGLKINWYEKKISKTIHTSIKTDVKFKKVINTIDEGIVKEFINNNENSYRGGGIHLNISGIPDELKLSLILDLYKKWYMYNNANSCWKSFYRNNLIFRFKTECKDGFDGVELMCLGFKLKDNFNSFDEFYTLTKHFFHLFDPIVDVLNRYDKLINKIQN